MEKTDGEWKEKQVIQYYSSSDRKTPPEEVKLAAIAVSLNIRLRSADMAIPMQERALRLTRSLIDSSSSRRPNLTLLARSLKKEFDRWYGPAWHCVAGKSFGSFVASDALAGRIFVLLCRFLLFSSIQNRGALDLQRSPAALSSLNFSVFFESTKTFAARSIALND